ncbi:MAG: hypothetical protein P8Y45_19720 [Exilibacterium sp.]
MISAIPCECSLDCGGDREIPEIRAGCFSIGGSRNPRKIHCDGHISSDYHGGDPSGDPGAENRENGDGYHGGGGRYDALCGPAYRVPDNGLPHRARRRLLP